jgi:hypothetical protein
MVVPFTIGLSNWSLIVVVIRVFPGGVGFEIDPLTDRFSRCGVDSLALLRGDGVGEFVCVWSLVIHEVSVGMAAFECPSDFSEC